MPGILSRSGRLYLRLSLQASLCRRVPWCWNHSNKHIFIFLWKLNSAVFIILRQSLNFSILQTTLFESEPEPFVRVLQNSSAKWSLLLETVNIGYPSKRCLLFLKSYPYVLGTSDLLNRVFVKYNIGALFKPLQTFKTAASAPERTNQTKRTDDCTNTICLPHFMEET